MARMAQWLDMVFEVNDKRLHPLMNFSASKEVDEETNNDSKGSAQKKQKGYKLRPLTCSTTVGAAKGTNARLEYEKWESRVGKSAPFILGSRRWGAQNYTLKKAELAEVMVTPNGGIVDAEIQLTFEESGQEAAKNKAKSQKKSAPGIAPESGSVSALYIGANAEDKAAKKPANPFMNGEVFT